MKSARLGGSFGMVFAIVLVAMTVAPVQAAATFSNFPPIIQGKYLGGQTLAIDSAGNRYVAGSFTGTKEFNPGGASVSKTSAGGDDVCVTCFNANGTWKWTQTFGGSGDEFAYAIALSSDGATVYVAGEFNSPSAQIGGAGGAIAPNIVAKNSGFVMALNATNGAAVTTFGLNLVGGRMGVTRFGSGTANSEAFVVGIAVSPSALYVAGGFINSCQCNSGNFVTAAGGAASGDHDTMVCAISPTTGDPITTFGFQSSGIQTFGGTGFEDTFGIAIDGTSLYVTGSFASTNAKIGGGGAAVATSGGDDAFLIKLNTSDGKADLAFNTLTPGIVKFGGSTGDPVNVALGSGVIAGADHGHSVVVLGNNVYMAGDFASNNAGINGTGSIKQTLNGLNDGFVAAFNKSTGAAVGTFGTGGVKTFGGGGTDDVSCLYAAGTTVYVSGSMSSLDFKVGGTNPAFSITGGTAQNGGDAMVLALDASSGAPVTTFGTSGVVQFGGTKNEYGYSIAPSGTTALFLLGLSTSADAGPGGVVGPYNSTGYDGFLLPLDVTSGKILRATGVISSNVVFADGAAGTANFAPTATDAGTFAYSFASGAGSTDNSLATLTGNALKTKSAIVAVTKNQFSFRIRNTEAFGMSVEDQFVFTAVVPANPPPTGISLTPLSVVETSLFVGNLATNPIQDYEYSLVSGENDSDNQLFDINRNIGSVNQIAAVAAFNKPNLKIRVRSTNRAGAFIEKAFAITVTPRFNSGADLKFSNPLLNAVIVNPDSRISITVTNSAGGTYRFEFGPAASFKGSPVIQYLDKGPDGKPVIKTAVYGSGIDGNSSGNFSASYTYSSNGLYLVQVADAPVFGGGTSVLVAQLAIPVSGAETGTQHAARDERSVLRVLGDPPSFTPVTKTLKGKFLFDGSKADSVTYSGTIKMPSNFDVTKGHDFSIALGTVIVDTTIDAKGKATATTNKDVLKSLKFTKPKVKKGALTKGGEDATVTVTYSKAGLLAAGFQYEGLTTTAPDIKPGGTAARHIQVAMLLDGIPYFVYQPATYGLSKDSKTATIGLAKK